jgi:DNA/RNA-binding domain of Phe-tRNA-synthetase-like protein
MSAMTELLPPVRHELPGWTLCWAAFSDLRDDPERLATLRAGSVQNARASYVLEKLAEHATVAAIRALFRQAGCDPTRYRPSSEALLRRVLKGEELPAIHPLVDLNNCLSIELAVPACVIDVETVYLPLVLRSGAQGERMLSMRGDFDLSGKPLLADQEGPFGTPITDSERVKVRSGTREVWMVAYLAAGVVAVERAHEVLRRLLEAAPVATLLATGATT